LGKNIRGDQDDFFLFFQKYRVGPYFWPFCRMD
jgi:hypothetical protein